MENDDFKARLAQFEVNHDLLTFIQDDLLERNRKLENECEHLNHLATLTSVIALFEKDNFDTRKQLKEAKEDAKLWEKRCLLIEAKLLEGKEKPSGE